MRSGAARLARRGGAAALHAARRRGAPHPAAPGVRGNAVVGTSAFPVNPPFEVAGGDNRAEDVATVFHRQGATVAAVPSLGRADRAVAPEAELTQALYERHATQIFRYCLHQLGSREEAEDAVQSTFLNAFRGVKRGIVPEHESAWLFKIAENVCLSRRRSTWRRGRVESPTDFEVVEELTPAPSRLADELVGLQDVLEQMPESQRRAILLREWQGLSYREIAEELGLTQAAVETLIFRARRSLAQGLEQHLERRPAGGKSSLRVAGRRASA